MQEPKKKKRATNILHELLADRSDFLAESGREHHDLFVMRCATEDLLNIAAHV